MPANSRRYLFSGHESFFCKPLWLKKGYDAYRSGTNFSSPEAVAVLGVGKNMVSSIRYWLNAFGILENGAITPWAEAIFRDGGYDPYLEDEGTLWLLHYALVSRRVASIYALTFLDFRREKKVFDKAQLQAFIRRKCNDPEQKNTFNANTVSKDISVLLHNYLLSEKAKSNEDYSAIFLDLGLMVHEDSDRYAFGETPLSRIHPDILLYVLLDYREKTLSLDALQEIALIFGLTMTDLAVLLRQIVQEHPEAVTYTDNSGVKNLQFLKELDPAAVLGHYYTGV